MLVAGEKLYVYSVSCSCGSFVYMTSTSPLFRQYWGKNYLQRNEDWKECTYTIQQIHKKKFLTHALTDKHHSNIIIGRRVDSNMILGYTWRALVLSNQVHKWNILEEAITFILSSPWVKCKQALLHTVYLLRYSWGGGGGGGGKQRTPKK